MKYLKQAMEAITEATAGGGLQRDAALRWFEAKQQASGEEAALIAESAEALMVGATGPGDRHWLQALVEGGLQAAARAELNRRMQDEAMQLDSPSGRGDAAEEGEPEQPEQDGGFDWALIARETAEMVKLNKDVPSSMQDATGSDPETKTGSQDQD
jgi:hypothetical protein